MLTICGSHRSVFGSATSAYRSICTSTDRAESTVRRAWRRGLRAHLRWGRSGKAGSYDLRMACDERLAGRPGGCLRGPWGWGLAMADGPLMAGKSVLVTGGTGVSAWLPLPGWPRWAPGRHPGRDLARTGAAAAGIRAAPGSPAVDGFAADLPVQAGVRRLAAQVRDIYPRLDVLVNNAGGFWAHRHVTADGLERAFALDHLRPFLLTSLLLGRLTASAPVHEDPGPGRGHPGLPRLLTPRSRASLAGTSSTASPRPPAGPLTTTPPPLPSCGRSAPGLAGLIATA